jgi:hypothetical protein
MSPKSTSHTNSDSEWENETFEICKFKGLLILNAILNFLVCNMMKVFTRQTSASDFFTIFHDHRQTLGFYFIMKEAFFEKNE